MIRAAKGIFLASIVTLGITIAGCDSSGIDETDPPNVVSTDAFGVETFSQSAGKSAAGPHLTAAALRYAPVSIVLGLKYLLVPKIVTELATAEEPTLVEGEWVWSAEKETAVGPVSFTLTGRPEGEMIDWSMIISANNAYTGTMEAFELYAARTTSDGSEGTWELYHKNDDGVRVNVLDASFGIASPVEKQITFSVPETAEEHAGYEVRYERDGNLRTFYWNQPDTGNEHTLTWNPELGVGSIQSTNYKDGEKYCWDSAGEDASCG